jgi:hypothetical protein
MNRIINLAIVLTCISMTGCKQDDITLSSDAVVIGGVAVDNDLSDAAKAKTAASLTASGAQIFATVDNENNLNFKEYGAYLSPVQGFSIGQAQKFTSSDYGKVEGFDANHFSVTPSNLKDNTTYYYRFYVSHDAGLSYSALDDEASFTTPKNYRVPDMAILSAAEIHERIIKCAILHNGYYAIKSYGIYIGKDSTNMQKLAATKCDSTGIYSSAYSVDITSAGINIGDAFYCKAYAVNERGEGVSPLTQIKLARILEPPTFGTTTVKVLSKTEAKVTFTLATVGYSAITEYGYYINGKKVKVAAAALSAGDTYTAAITGLTAGKAQAIYPYAVNGDGESKAIDPTIFMSGIPGKNEGDQDIVYQDLSPVTADGVTYIFLDRNLGAADAYPTGSGPVDPRDAGCAFQWGRSADGHQLWSSTVAKVPGGASYPLSSDYVGKFIANSSSYRWTPSLTGLSGLWDDSETGGTNNPCPAGYHVASYTEMNVFLSNKANMNMPTASVFRTASWGAVNKGDGYYWTSTLAGDTPYPYLLKVSTGKMAVSSSYGQGSFVRCVRVAK